MNLAIDIGNTHTKAALFEGDELVILSAPGQNISTILSQHKIENAIIAKTGVNNEIDELLRKKNIPVLFLTPQLKLPLHLLYKTPQTLGADRIAGSVAAARLFPAHNVLKIDFGTCITYDFVNANQFHGGAISPGMMVRFKALHHYTPKLPLVDPLKFSSFELIGNDTGTAILSGVVNGIKEEVEGIIKQYDTRFGNLRTVITGGDAGFFVTLLKNQIFASPNLVLEGLNMILNFNV